MDVAELVKRLRVIEGHWRSLEIVEDLQAYGRPGYSKSYVGDFFGGLAIQLERAFPSIKASQKGAQTTDPLITKVIADSITPQLAQFDGWISAMPSNPQAYVSTVIDNLLPLRRVIYTELLQGKGSSRSGSAKLEKEISSTTAAIRSALEVRDELTKLVQGLKETVSATESSRVQATQRIDELNKMAEAATQTLATLETYLGSSKASVSAIQESKQSLDDLVSSSATTKEELRVLTEKNRSLLDQVGTTLEAANKKGLAGSYLTKTQSLAWIQIFWGGVFGVALVIIYILTSNFLEEIQLAGILKSDNLHAFVIQLLVKLSLVAPFIWAAWFAVRQYGHSSRLKEDYAFKVASAMALDGYKQEAADADPEILKKLLDIAVQTFGQNPIRIFEIKNDSETPLQDLLK